MQTDPQQINDIQISPDGRHLAAVSGYELSAKPGTCCIWDMQTEKIVADFQAAKGPLNALAFSPDGSELIAGGGLFSGPSEVWHWTQTTKAVPLSWAAIHTHSIYALAWSPNARSVLFNCNNAKLTVAEDAREIRYVKQVSTPGLSNAAALAYSPDGTQVAAALRQTYFEKDKANGCIAIFNASDMTPRTDILAPLTGGLSTLDYSPDGKFIATGGYDGFVYVLDASTLAIKAWWNVDHGILYKVRWSPDGKKIATVGSMDIVAVWPLKL
jgi:WD40 repeat protein